MACQCIAVAPMRSAGDRLFFLSRAEIGIVHITSHVSTFVTSMTYESFAISLVMAMMNRRCPTR